MKTVRLQLRFLLPLVAVLVAASYLAVPLMDQVTLRWFSRDLNSRGVLVASALSDSVGEALIAGRPGRLQPLFDRTVQDERLLAVGLCSPDGRLLQRTAGFPPTLGCAQAQALAGQAEPRLALPGGAVHVGVHDVMGQPPAPPAERVNPAPGVIPDEALASLGAAAPAIESSPPPPLLTGRLVLLHDMSFIERRSQDTRRYLIGLIAGLGLVIAVITVVVAQLSWRGWVTARGP